MNERDGIYDITWNWPVFLSQLLGFAVIVGALVKLVVPQVKAMMHRSQHTIREQLEESSQAAAQLAAAERVFAEADARARIEVAHIHREARTDAERILAELRKTAAAEVERVRRHGMDHLQQVRRQLREELGHDLTTTVLDRAERVVRERLGSPGARSDSIDRVLDELAGVAEKLPSSS
ncbi:F0F1 ATP synthase subunit B family protein [Nocardia sp. Marseille-Q1738]